jgi:aryl-alcohol dehydrogenase-like predicted oxidoreductase
MVTGPERLTAVFDLEKKTDYSNIIKPRKGEPQDKELYARVKAAAKKKFRVYPSAVANAWVVAEYKRRGGKY